MKSRRMKSKRILSVRGVEVYRLADGTESVVIRYSVQGKPKYETVGKSVYRKGRNVTIAKAHKLLARRRAQRDQGRLLAPERPTLAGREHLRFEAVAERYLGAEASRYARPKERYRLFEVLKRAFAGRYLDEIIGPDILQYREHRIAGEGVFRADGPVGPDTPRLEIGALSAAYEFLRAEGTVLKNPCHGYRPRLRRKDDRLEGRPRHRAVIPTPVEREALFTADPVDRQGRRRVKPAFRAFWRLLYYTASRPEELARLRRGDVVLAGDERARFGRLGWVTFRETKSGDDRVVPLHPAAEAALVEVLGGAGRPEDPVFAKRGRPGVAWTKESYKKAWAAVLAEVTVAHPRLAQMWVRDWRKAAISDMRAAGTEAAIASRVAGHSTEMSYHYSQATQPAAEAAIMTLGSGPACGTGGSVPQVPRRGESRN